MYSMGKTIISKLFWEGLEVYLGEYLTIFLGKHWWGQTLMLDTTAWFSMSLLSDPQRILSSLGHTNKDCLKQTGSSIHFCALFGSHVGTKWTISKLFLQSEDHKIVQNVFPWLLWRELRDWDQYLRNKHHKSPLTLTWRRSSVIL